MSDKPAGPDLTFHMCQSCGVFGMYGFGHTDVRWYCAHHREVGKAWWTSMRGNDGAGRSGPTKSPGMF